MGKLKTWIGIALVACYAVGLVALIVGQVSLGLMLWVVSTLGGMGLLWYSRQKENEREGEPPAR